MWRVDRTIDSDGRSPVAERILERWEHEPGSARFFRSSANFVYLLRTAGRRHFLRFADSAERSRGAVEAESELVDWLGGAGIRVARPVRSRNGRFVETVATNLGVFHAVVFVGLDGDRLEIGDLDESRFQAWGAALGGLHAALKRYSGAGGAARSTWQDHLAFVAEHIPVSEAAVRRELDRVASTLHALPMQSDSYGLIHFDFELDNLCWRDHVIGSLDFDDCAHYWHVADIAFALRDLFEDGVDLDHPSLRAFVRGYSTACPLDERLLTTLPVFLRLAKLMSYARLARALDLPLDPEHPDWLTALNLRLKRRMQAYTTSLKQPAS
jgi:Ser/Thr protein kinase RdoA (MazF antagonist)